MSLQSEYTRLYNDRESIADTIHGVLGVTRPDTFEDIAEVLEDYDMTKPEPIENTLTQTFVGVIGPMQWYDFTGDSEESDVNPAQAACAILAGLFADRYTSEEQAIDDETNMIELPVCAFRGLTPNIPYIQDVDRVGSLWIKPVWKEAGASVESNISSGIYKSLPLSWLSGTDYQNRADLGLAANGNIYSTWGGGALWPSTASSASDTPAIVFDTKTSSGRVIIRKNPSYRGTIFSGNGPWIFKMFNTESESDGSIYHIN